MMLSTAKAASTKRYFSISPGKIVSAKRMNPYAPSLLTMPAKNTSTAGGHASYRSGNHVCSGTIGSLMAKASAKQMNASSLGVNVLTWMMGMTNALPELMGCARMLSRSNEPDGDWMYR